MPTTEQFDDAVALAVPHWGLEPVSAEVLSYSENMVYDVALGDGRHVVMRLHRPGYNTIEEMESEVRWVASLGAAGVPVPEPVPTLEGDFYVAVAVGREERHVGVVEWVDGTPLGGPIDDSDESVVDRYGQIGELAAMIRAQYASWEKPDGFVRRRWDAEGLVGQEPLWGRFWDLEPLTKAQRTLFAKARAELYDTLMATSTGKDRFGLIHADLHLGNLMADGERLTVIDFDDSGFGWFAHELAVALHPVFDEPTYEPARDALLNGYGRVHPLGDDEIRLIDTFLTIRCLMIVSWLDARRELPAHEYFGNLVAHAEEVAQRYLTSGVL